MSARPRDEATVADAVAEIVSRCQPGAQHSISRECAVYACAFGGAHVIVVSSSTDMTKAERRMYSTRQRDPVAAEQVRAEVARRLAAQPMRVRGGRP